ncbi:MAG: YARHG domain-containing protein, partial [Alphaproteobacteria bacterium]
DRQGRSLDAEGVVRRSWQDVHLTKPVPILFTHSVLARPEIVGPQPELADQQNAPAVAEIFQQIDSLFEPDQCEPANGWILPCSDMRVLSKADIRHLRPSELLRAQYEIRARKGSYFADPTVQQYFQQFPWYEPFTKSPYLSDIEQANSALLQNTRIQQLDGLDDITN